MENDVRLSKEIYDKLSHDAVTGRDLRNSAEYWEASGRAAKARVEELEKERDDLQVMVATLYDAAAEADRFEFATSEYAAAAARGREILKARG